MVPLIPALRGRDKGISVSSRPARVLNSETLKGLLKKRKPGPTKEGKVGMDIIEYTPLISALGRRGM